MARGDVRHVLRRAAVSCIFDVGQCNGAMLDPGLIDFGGATDKSTWLRRERCRSSNNLGWQVANSTGRVARGHRQKQASKMEGESVGMWCAIRGSAEACSQAWRQCHVVNIACF